MATKSKTAGKKTYAALATVGVGLVLKHFAPDLPVDADTANELANGVIELGTLAAAAFMRMALAATAPADKQDEVTPRP